MKVLQQLTNMSDKLFTNKIFLYVMFFIALLQIVFFIDSRKFNALFFLIAFGIILRQFTFNNATVLFVAILLTNAFLYISPALEGMSGFRGARSRHKEELNDEDRFERFKERLKNHRMKYRANNEEDEEDKEDNIKNIESFSKIKTSRKPKQMKSFSAKLPTSIRNNPRLNNPHMMNNPNIVKYNQIKDKYKDLVATIKEKTASIKALSKQIKT